MLLPISLVKPATLQKLLHLHVLILIKRRSEFGEVQNLVDLLLCRLSFMFRFMFALWLGFIWGDEL